MERITAADASRDFFRLLDRLEHRGESFTIERNGCVIAELRPVSQPSTVGDLIEFLRDVPLPDPDFRADMLEIIDQSSRDVGRDALPEDES